MTDLPAPLTPADCDCTDLDGFMLNVERLMASELVALATHEVIGAAVLLWCRAWKQTPAASLPDDDRIIAAFARLPLPRFRKLRAEILRGFVKCSDGRLYHRTLAVEATRAFARKQAFRNKRETDAERLRKWRRGKYETQSETPHETQSETRFVAEGQGQGQVYISPPTPSPGESGTPSKRQGTRIPSDWRPRDETRAYAARLKLEAWEIDAAAIEFREYWLSRTERRVDWDLSFKTRLRDIAADQRLRAKLQLVERAPDAAKPIDWAFRLDYWRTERAWPAQWGPKPSEPDYRGPTAGDLPFAAELQP